MSSGSHADTTQEQKGAEWNHMLNANLKTFIAVALVSYFLSIDQRVKYELDKLSVKWAAELFTPHLGYSEQGGLLWGMGIYRLNNLLLSYLSPMLDILECKALELAWEVLQASVLGVQKKSWHRSFETW